MNQSNLQFNELKIGDRIRQDVKSVEELADSIRQYGLIQPIVVNQRDELIDGGRRTTALERLFSSQTTDATEQSIVDFIRSSTLVYGVHFIRKETNSIDHLGEQELEANIQREDFTWQEEVLAVAKIHKIKKRSAALVGDAWGFIQTGRILKKSNAHVKYCEMVADCIKANDKEVIKAEGITAALKV
ncbi:MAG: ParB/RepB/Spo0J family partition protein, partial [Candidatus Thorarchaeota archaeon]